MRHRKIVAAVVGVHAGALAVVLALSSCGGGHDGSPAPVALPASVTPAQPSPSRTDPAMPGCAEIRALGVTGTPDDYRGAAAILAGSGDARLAAAAVVLHDATGTTLEPVDTRAERLAMLDAVLNIAEECLRVVG